MKKKEEEEGRVRKREKGGRTAAARQRGIVLSSCVLQIHHVGINEERLVSHSNSNFWSMTPEDVTKGDAPFISYLPWSSVYSSDPISPW
jgi:hypothetical protein